MTNAQQHGDAPRSDTQPHEIHGDGRIVVGVDGSAESKLALRWAGRQAALTGSSIEAVMTWHIPATAYGAPVTMPTGYDFAPGAARTLDETIREVLGADPAVKVVASVEEGLPALKLLEAAKGADLLVMGSRGHGAFAGMLLGSVSEHCVAHASCPVVVVRHAESPNRE